MKQDDEIGKYSKETMSDIPFDIISEAYLKCKESITIYPGQAVYVYSLVQRRMIFASGWFDILGIEDDKVSLLSIVESTASEYMQFANELNDKALLFVSQRTKDLEQYSFSFELKKKHKDGRLIPVMSRITPYKVSNGVVEEILGTSLILKNLNMGKVMQYSVQGPDAAEFEDLLNKELFHHYIISQKEKDALKLASQGHTFKEIARIEKVSVSAIEKRIIPLYKRFKVKSLPHLVSFAYENHIF